ncbi:hypothetical protein HYQ46_012432 [Verticillium longisporum]|nr:hypothetical protein HYQ46_012432 [Verticillium longisporum]
MSVPRARSHRFTQSSGEGRTHEKEDKDPAEVQKINNEERLDHITSLKARGKGAPTKKKTKSPPKSRK